MATRARWGGLRPDPYNPNAFDADGDGIVQEGTAFERPASTVIVDGAGNPIQANLRSNTRPQDWRIVDRNTGRVVPYVPSYQRAPSQPIANQVGTIGSRVGTLKDMVGIIGERAPTLESAVGTIVSAPDARYVNADAQSFDALNEPTSEYAAPNADTLSADEPTLSSAFVLDFDSERADASEEIKRIKTDALSQIYSFVPPGWIEKLDFNGQEIFARSFPDELGERDWFDAVEEFARKNPGLSENERNLILKNINDVRVAEDLDEISRWTSPRVAVPNDPFSRDPFAPLDATPVEEAPYTVEEARRLYMETLQRFSKTTLDSIVEKFETARRERNRLEGLSQAAQTAVAEELLAKRKRMLNPVDVQARAYNPQQGKALVGQRNISAKELTYGEVGGRSVEELQAQADDVLVKAGDLTQEVHEEELASLLLSQDMTELIEEITANASISGSVENIYGKKLIERLIAVRELDGDALTVSDEELDDMIATGYLEVTRGGSVYPNSQFLDGDMLIGTGIDGAGLYFASETFHPDGLLSMNPEFSAAEYARLNLTGGGGTVIRGAINPSANRLSIDRVQKELSAYRAHRDGMEPELPDSRLYALRKRLATKAESDETADRALKSLDSILFAPYGETNHAVGFAAILMGYDAIRDNADSNRTILYNRSAVVVANRTITPDEAEKTTGYENFKFRYNERLRSKGDLPLDPSDQEIKAWSDKRTADLMAYEGDARSAPADTTRDDPFGIERQTPQVVLYSGPTEEQRPTSRNLPVTPLSSLPAEMLDQPNMDKVNELLSKLDDAQQLIPRAIASAFYTGDFSWIVDQFAFDAAGYASMGGEPEPVEGLTLADLAYAMQEFREDAQASVRNLVDEDGLVTVYRGGGLGSFDEPVSVSVDKSDAEQFGDVVAYKAPLSAFEYAGQSGSYAGEYLVNPSLLRAVDDQPNTELLSADTSPEVTLENRGRRTQPRGSRLQQGPDPRVVAARLSRINSGNIKKQDLPTITRLGLRKTDGTTAESRAQSKVAQLDALYGKIETSQDAIDALSKAYPFLVETPYFLASKSSTDQLSTVERATVYGYLDLVSDLPVISRYDIIFAEAQEGAGGSASIQIADQNGNVFTERPRLMFGVNIKDDVFKKTFLRDLSILNGLDPRASLTRMETFSMKAAVSFVYDALEAGTPIKDVFDRAEFIHTFYIATHEGGHAADFLATLRDAFGDDAKIDEIKRTLENALADQGYGQIAKNRVIDGVIEQVVRGQNEKLPVLNRIITALNESEAQLVDAFTRRFNRPPNQSELDGIQLGAWFGLVFQDPRSRSTALTPLGRYFHKHIAKIYDANNNTRKAYNVTTIINTRNSIRDGINKANQILSKTKYKPIVDFIEMNKRVIASARSQQSLAARFGAGIDPRSVEVAGLGRSDYGTVVMDFPELASDFVDEYAGDIDALARRWFDEQAAKFTLAFFHLTNNALMDGLSKDEIDSVRSYGSEVSQYGGDRQASYYNYSRLGSPAEAISEIAVGLQSGMVPQLGSPEYYAVKKLFIWMYGEDYWEKVERENYD